jgi:hypothetical protein
MSDSIRLYHFLHDALKSLGQLGRKENRVTLAMLMVGIFKGQDVRLGRIAQQVPLGITQDSVEQRFRRWRSQSIRPAPLRDGDAYWQPPRGRALAHHRGVEALRFGTW